MTSAPLTAAQEILLAAADLVREGRKTFSEWDLTVNTWRRNKNRFGCRGYEDDYPDHKRVMMEIMGKTKKDNPLRRGWLTKIKPNVYRLTDLGQAEAERLDYSALAAPTSQRSPQAIYDAILPFIQHRVFLTHSRDAEEPRMWLGAASFLGLTQNDADHLRDRLRILRDAIDKARKWMDETRNDSLRRGVTGGGVTIHRKDIDRLES